MNSNEPEKKEDFQLYIENAPEGIFITNSRGQYLDVNPAACVMTGYSREELLQMSLFQLISPDIPPLTSPSFEKLKQLGKLEIEVTLQKKNGTIFNATLKSIALSENRYMGFCVDITAKRQAEEILRMNEEKYRTLFESSQDAIILIDISQGFVDCNEATVKMFGIPNKEDFIHHNFTKFMPQVQPDGNLSQDKYKYFLQDIMEKGFSESEWVFKRQNGDEFHGIVQTTKINIKDRTLLQETIRDNTLWNQAKEELKTERRRLADIIKGTNVGTWEWDVNEGTIEINDRWAEILGYTKKELEPVSFSFWESITHPEDIIRSNEMLLRHFSHELDHYECEVRMHHKNEGWVWILDRGRVALWDDAGNPLLMSGTHQDISQRKQIEEELQASQLEYKNLLNAIPDMVWACDTEERFTYASESWRTITGYDPQELIGKPFWELMVKEDDAEAGYKTEEFQEKVKDKFDGLKVVHESYRDFVNWNYHKNGEKRCHTSSAVPRYNKDGHFIGYIGIDKDITEQIEAELALKESEKKFREMANLLPQIVFETDINGTLTFVNKRAFEIFGYTLEDFDKGINALQVIVPEDRERGKNNIEKILHGESIENSEYLGLGKDGNTFPIMLYSAPIIKNNLPSGLRGIIVDITERKKFEEQMVQSQKLDAIGQLAAGVAHDFNNILAGILGVSELLKDWEGMDTEHLEFVDMIIQDTKRATALTTKLLAFGRKEKIKYHALDIHKTIKDTITILERSIDKRVNIQLELLAQLPIVIGDESQLQNAFINIGINADHAMPQGGNLKFTTKNMYIDENFSQMTSVQLIPGNYILISISDTGCGMPKENLLRIFDPFYTTKSPGKGTGLGLSMVYGIIQDHKGAIFVDSEVGIGSVFSIFLPLSLESVPMHAIDSEIIRGSGTILLIDDEAMVRIPAKLLLESMGYTIISAENGQEGVDIYKNSLARIDLIILDMIMPVMNGLETFEILRQINPNCKVIISSGYIKDEILQELEQTGISGIIRKPFRKYELSHLIATILKS